MEVIIGVAANNSSAQANDFQVNEFTGNKSSNFPKFDQDDTKDNIRNPLIITSLK